MIEICSFCVSMARDQEVNDFLREVYYDVSRPAGYGSVKDLYLAVRNKGFNVNIDRVKT